MRVQLSRGAPPLPPDPPSVETPPKKRSINRIFVLDCLLVTFLALAVWHHTPIGRLPVWAYHFISKTKSAAPSSGTVLKNPPSGQLTFESGRLSSYTLPENIELSAKRLGGDAKLLTTIALTLGSCDEKTCRIPAPPHLATILDTGVTTAQVNSLQLALAMSKAAEELWGNQELALEALFVGAPNVRQAIHFARIAGKERPESIEEHLAFFPSHVPKASIQKVRTILGNHRLRYLTWPAPSSAIITSPFGIRTHPITKRRVPHNGIDIHAKVGDPIVSVHHGQVTRTGRDALSGNYVKVDHGFGIETSYSHLDQILAKTGERLKKGTPVGRAGSTGRVTGPHLHFTLKLNGRPVDPQQFGHSQTKSSKPIAVSSGAR